MASQHLAFCFACTLRSLPPERGAALLLVEVYGFTFKETAEILSASWAQVKNWLQEARAALSTRYADMCALVNKKGVCYQCSELAVFFNGQSENPLAETSGAFEDRLRVVRYEDGRDLSVWHRLLLRIIERRAAAKRAVSETRTDES